MSEPFRGKALPLNQEGMAEVIERLQTTVAELWAVLTVETRGCGFLPDRRPMILFERHIFSRETNHQFDNAHPDISNRKTGGYGPGGAAIIISTLTDSRNRTAQEIKHLLSEMGLALAAPGSASWAFEKTGDRYVPKTTVTLSEADQAKLMEILEKIDAHDDVEEVVTNGE